MTNRGFTLLETLVVLAIMAIVMGGATAFYQSYLTGLELNSTAEGIFSDLRRAQSKALSGIEDSDWGIVFYNQADDSSDYYEFYSYNSTLGTTTVSTTTLSPGLDFTAPAEGGSTNFRFGRGTGLPATAGEITIDHRGESRTITVVAGGQIKAD